MATEQTINRLREIIERIKSIDRAKLIRENLGEESLANEIEPVLNNIDKRIEFALLYSGSVYDSVVGNVTSIFSVIYDKINAQCNVSSADFISRKREFISQITNDLDNLNQHWPHFICAAIEQRGFLEDEGIRQEYSRKVEELRGEAQAAVSEVKKQSNEAIEEARQLAKQIEERARRTATKISVEEAKNQFKEAQKDIKNKAIFWGVSSLICIGIFLYVAYYLIEHAQPPKDIGWYIFYYTAMRLVILGVSGGAAAFCLRIFRAYLHMNQMNLHRQRVANSIAAFVESAVTPEQRDQILMRCVDAVVSFGPSGLLAKERGEDQMPLQRMPVEVISKCVAGSAQQH
ncbi:MAG: hypothetical protein HY910_11590 [Desulfarculus sp.]|nr:hypothetical protein [Desulfarculus sp.]